MKYPKLKELDAKREMIDVFKGYNHNLRIGEGEFYEMTNLSSADYPVLSPRQQRGVYAGPNQTRQANRPQGMIAKDELCYVDGEAFVVGIQRIEMGLTLDTEPKTLVSMGAYVIIMPDKKYVNTADLSDYGDIEASVTTTSTVNFSLCKIDGAGYENVAAQATAPSAPKNMDLWIDTSNEPNTLKQYSESLSQWVSIATTYIKISATGIGAPLAENDGVTISGITDPALSDLNNTMVIWARGEDYIVVTGILNKVMTQSTAVTVERRMPNMDFLIESNNRLWGCRYGKALNGESVNEIYASKLGDFRNWSCFMGISTDSYAASVGTDGPFTGAITHSGYPLFFKEGHMHKVYGNYPPYTIQDMACRGVQKGCSRSMAIVNEILYYKSRTAVCAYDGSLPTEISYAFGEERYSDAAAGALGNKYYISMMDALSVWHFFVYDTAKGMWHREDNTQATCFCTYRGDLYFVDHWDNNIRTVRGTGVLDTSTIRWSGTTGTIGTDSPDTKYVSRIDVRMKLNVGSTVSLYVEYDSCGVWEHLFTMTGTELRSFAVPVRAKRCDHMRLRIDGTGDANVYSICKTVEKGGSD